MGIRKKDELFFLLLALPSLLGMLLFFVIPYGMALYFSMIDNNVLRNFVGLANYIDIFQSGAFSMALKNTGIFMGICVPANMVIPLIMAMLLKNAGKGGRSIFGVLFLLPLVIPSGSIVHFWNSVFSYNGALNRSFFWENPVNWLDTAAVRGIIVLIFIWKNAGYNMILFWAGLLMIPPEYYECLYVEGGGKVRAFFSVTLVYLAPATFLVLVMSVINSFKAFKEIYLLSGAYPHNTIYMLQHYMNNQFQALNYQKLSAASVVVSVGIMIIVGVLLKFQEGRK